MLTGTIKYIRQSVDNEVMVDKFDVKAVDISTTFMGKITSGSYRAIYLMSGQDNDEDALWERRFDIGLSSVKVETRVTRDNNGKKVKSPINYDFFCRLASIIRYAKHNCSKSNMQGYTGLELASGEYVPESVTTYNIPFECKEGYLGTVSLNLGEICAIHLKTDDFEIDLDQNNFVEEEVFYAIKDSNPKGIQFNAEYLGFDVKPPVIVKNINSSGFYSSLEEIIANHPDREYDWLLKNKYIIVTDDILDEVCEKIMAHEGYVFFDTETSGLNITFKSRLGAEQGDQLVGVVLTINDGEAYYFPTQMKSIPNLCNGDHFYFMEHYMKPILEGKELVAHNMPFDWKVAYIYDINANIVHDTLALYRLTVGAEKKNFSLKLKVLVKLFLMRDSLELSDLVVDDSWGTSDVRFWDLPYELVRLYACADTDNTKGLLDYATRNELLQKYNATRVYEIEIAFSYAVAYQEFYGHKIDTDNLEALHKAIDEGLKENMAKMVEIVGYEFNPNSPPQLLRIMYQELGIPTQISRKTGRPTTDKETLTYLSELTDIEGNVKYPFVKYLKEYRVYEGVRKIIDKFPELATPDGYLFSEVQQFGTTTGRVAMKEPNYQSYNDPVKKNIIPRPGFWMGDTDYSSVEYRVLGSMAGNEMIKEGFKDPDFDYHAYQASRMYNVPYAAVTKALRKAAKGINFGLPYGMGDESLGIRVFGEKSPENTRKAGVLRNAYFKGQEDIQELFDASRAQGVSNGFTETFFGRRRYYHRSDFSVNAIRRQAGNHVIQGCQDLNTRILTKEFGIVRLGDVLNTNVTVWDGLKWSNGDVLPAGNKRKTVIKFKGGQTMICSPTHKFLVSTKGGNVMWVEAQDLHTTSEYRNPHRILVNPQHAMADYVYKSNRKYDCHTSNANNVYLSDVNDSYKVGIILGRLASDGHQTLHHSGSNAIVQIIAEHEYNILPKLKECLENLGYYEDSDGTREDRNEEITRLTVYSTSLSKEIDDLDIRHKVHRNIFMDTELLRGFLCGYFDGDGGISGKTITCVFGKQDDFQTLVEDMQKALLFFGVRSRIREYDDRWVLQIKTNDNELFLKEIGFLNSDKQIAGAKLHCIEEEKTFGKCIIPESVEVTDELIPMADVCNTDGGYYVADGIITHNTAADIYKLAVGRVFKRICKEGWLGKVLLTGFIHDELLFEVHNSINPMVFLKALREEFEVKIYNEDGTPWCPLYMGFGFGMSWYEAKSVELPIKLQWEFVEKYGELGYPDWDGNGRKFCDTIPDKLRDFSVRDVRKQLLDTESQGKQIKPTLNNALFDIIKEDSEVYEQALSNYMKDDYLEVAKMGEQAYIESHKDSIIEYLDKHYHIQGLYKDKDGLYSSNIPKTKETQEAIDLFCMLHDADRSVIDIQDIQDVSSVSCDDNPSEIYLDAEDDEDDAEAKQRRIDSRVNTLGMYLDTDDKQIILKIVPPQFMNFIKDHSNQDGVGYNVVFKDYEKKKTYLTKAYIKSDDITVIQSMYLQYFKAVG